MMISLKLADIFTNLAEIKKSVKGKKEEIISLMNAARTLRDDPGIIDSIIKAEEPVRTGGIDGYCRGLISEYLEKGSIEEYVHFAESYSEDLVRFIRMTGLGRDRMFAIYDEFSIRDMDGLKDIFEGKKAKGIIKGSGQKKDILSPLFVERIQWSLKYFESISGRIPRWPAEFYAGIITGHLEGLKAIKKAELTGSIRRKKSLVGDIDILVLPVFNDNGYDFNKSRQLLEHISKLPFIRKLLSVKREKDDISAVYETVYEIDTEIIIASRGTWTWQLFKTTGSREHLSVLKEYAVKNGMPHPDLAALANCGSEEEIYRFMGLEHIPVELRQGRDEIELSRRNRLPGLVRLEDIKGDLHIHSKWSDGMMQYREIIDAAQKLEYEYIGISDHSESNYYGNGLDTERLLKKASFMEVLKKKYASIDIFTGAEIDIKGEGIFDYAPDIIKRLEVAIASLHSSFSNSVDENTASAVSATEKDYFDLIAHPTGIVFGNRAPIFIDMDRLIEAAAENGKALEINSYYMRLDLDEENARKAKCAGARLSINTDSHRSGNMEMIQLGVDLARRAGLEPEDIINTMTAKEFRAWRKDRKKKGHSL